MAQEYFERKLNALADLRENDIREIAIIKSMLHDTMASGLAIGISPTDEILRKYHRGCLTKEINKLVYGIRERKDARMVRIRPLAFYIVGEYSDKFRWHYHGLIKVKDVKTLDKIKRKLQDKIGRVVVEQIRNVPQYLEYMFKQYTRNDKFYNWERKKCYKGFDEYIENENL